MLCSLLLITLSVCFQGEVDDTKSFQGKWKVVTVLEDGKSLSEQEIATKLVADGHFTVEGLVISMLPPGQFEAKKIPFVLNSKTEPKSIDLMGASKVGATGIYLHSGDSLMLCFPGINEKGRPTDFSNQTGSHRVLMVLQRVSAVSKATANASPAKAAPANPTPAPAPAPAPVTIVYQQLPAAPSTMQEMRSKLIGTWGHQSEESINYYTLNADGTFSTTVDWKSGIKNTFKKDQRASGTWVLENGVIVATIRASTEKEMINQVFSWRVTNLSDKNLVAIDNQGKARYEWRVR